MCEISYKSLGKSPFVALVISAGFLKLSFKTCGYCFVPLLSYALEVALGSVSRLLWRGKGVIFALSAGRWHKDEDMDDTAGCGNAQDGLVKQDAWPGKDTEQDKGRSLLGKSQGLGASRTDARSIKRRESTSKPLSPGRGILFPASLCPASLNSHCAALAVYSFSLCEISYKALGKCRFVSPAISDVFY
ncbi:hypothetical protein PVT67_12770 [Gallaecimonas kandeliae]|uniref:hypothetical protein n=1 Tax=Gallaecimonas kandeliae TaxID=3029055 RepID=UPI002649E802|nr:hypothetical protein [Gallaecimonas kandeliae]WKE64537.1 hypothetical protein PVT67_12770 [Gallaecimonas kandeliae]